MQQYGIPGAVNYDHVNKMLPAKNVTGTADNVHEHQKRRFFSCLVDGRCPEEAGGKGKRQARTAREEPRTAGWER
eukprot:Skav213132  [mRNA]  locus=scaffold107:314125:315917:+ [translate_table: standard]